MTEFGTELEDLAQDLIDTAKAYQAEGLAANQIGRSESVFVISHAGDYLVCVNPNGPLCFGEVNSTEGCLSFPGVSETLKRAESVEVSFFDTKGMEQLMTLTDVAAVAYQHELDHLNGIVFTDRMGPTKKRLALKKLNKVSRQGQIRVKRLERILANARGSAIV